MDGLINCVVGVVHALDGREGVVEISFLESLAMPVDIVQAAVRVDRDEVRGDTHMRAVFAVQGVEPEMAVAVEAVVELDPGGDASQERAGDATERVDEAVVEDVGEGLGTYVRPILNG